ncbi:hypothetical protein GALL_244110 [mine drainage metagenome]|uniref:Uncharacterized protein n=1 Tax=mine drainage metagenome TaxID=410659 RepID=A0A1J5RNJ5_9ZZZZ
MKQYLNFIRFSFFCFCVVLIPFLSYSQNPEFSLREFASSQIKKGVRSIGMGGDGATWGNYSLVWRDSATALIDAGLTSYSNNNKFSFTAVAAATPSIWHGLTVYAIALSQYAANISTLLKSPGFGTSATPVHGDGTNQALFIKSAMPLGKGFSVGVLFSYERSQFDAISDINSSNFVRYQTTWLPSGGFGLTWQPNKKILLGFRALFNNDKEIRIDNAGNSNGLNNSQEYRLGGSIALWKGALIDVGGNLRHRSNQINNNNHTDIEPNIGFEQNLWQRHFVFRFGVDETSPTGGFSIRFNPVVIDFAYVNNLAGVRLGDLFGTNSNSFIGTVLIDFADCRIKRK